MIRVVVQESPNLFALCYEDEATLLQTFVHNGRTYYRAETHNHYVLYRAAISGWGAGGTFDRAQR